MEKVKKFKFKKVSDLETIEEKSFWTTAPIIALIGLAGLFTSGFYASPLPTIASAILCLIIPSILMAFVLKKKNYHLAYPILCIAIGGISIPITFVFSGGFLSGMPLFCCITTGITALCYKPKYRFISFAACLLGNTIAFIYVFFIETPFPLSGTEQIYTDILGIRAVYKDVIFGYFCTAFGLFFSINYITNDIRRYKINQDTLQRFFDSEKRKEILKKSLNNAFSIKPEHKNAAILFADISNFTPITEKLPSDMISEFLKVFFTTAGKYIHETGGIIDKYIGDCIMAYWLDNEDENCVLNAVKAMLNLKSDVMRQTEDIFSRFGIELNFSVGVAYGDVIFGDIGSDTMHDYTVIGDAVNTASRIQDFAVSGEMILSDQAAERVKNSIALEEVEAEHFFKGKNSSISLYRILGYANERHQNLSMNHNKSNGYKLHICGCRGSFPVSGLRFSEYGGETSCYVIRKDDYAVIIDCGTGLKNAMKVVENCSHIDILLTHVHYDHILGLLMTKFPSTAHIRMFGRFASWDSQINSLSKFMERPYWPVKLVDTQKIDIKLGENIFLDKDIVATFYESDHPDDACVIKIMCMDKKIVFLADCEDATKLDKKISLNSDLVFFDGMYDDEEKEKHLGWGHGTWQDGIKFLNGRGIKKLVITHHNPELGDHSLMLKETKAREIAANVSFAKSGDIFNI